ncbi:MAG: hypothetical protein A3B68_03710 [Candidatus Melainabacteria bacterium RIFCSPHIGHO2_02_FULL_34_12]|nr:MAG: hypothetical protein A3B68_03710 [Candidatus Melainabacteria bacterium RIFCSPHIGHO2_02_FULL_34_12]
MSHAVNSINANQQANAVAATDQAQDNQFNGNQHREIAKDLLSESANFNADSKKKQEEAQTLLNAAAVMEKIADMLRTKAQQIQNGEVNKDKAIDEVKEIVETVLQVPVPKNATPEMLLDMADKFEAKGKENRKRADDLLIQSEHSASMATQLEKHAEMINKKDMKLSELTFRNAAAHNEGLNMVFKKLGIYRLDAEYKQQVEYAERRSKEQGLPS